MREKYILLAKSYETLAISYNKLANDIREEDVKTYCKEEDVSIESIRVILGEKLLIGKNNQIKALLRKYNAEKLSNVKEEDYKALFLEAKEI